MYIVPCRPFIRFVTALLEQLLSSCNDVNYANIDCHDRGDPNDLSDPGQQEEPAEEQDKQKYANLNLRALQSTSIFFHGQTDPIDLAVPAIEAPSVAVGLRACLRHRTVVGGFLAIVSGQ
jgi:hypothetical protein